MRHLTFATALTTLLFATPAAAAAKAAPASEPASTGAALDMKDLSVSAWVDGEFGDLDGVALRADAELPVMALTSKAKLVAIASLGFTHLGASPGGFDISWNMVKLLAIGRAQLELAPKLDVFGDIGLGFYYGGYSADVPWFDPYSYTWTTTTVDDTTGGFTMRFAAGASYQIDPKIKLGAELGFNPYFGDADTTNFFIGVGASYKL